MPLAPGSRIGVYEVITLIGSGGMGEVYRARDTRLERNVALKVLPDRVSADPQRAARFEREARTLASLSHPNIAVIHGLEDTSTAGPDQRPISALVMELIEGETLAERLTTGPLTVENALAIAREIADALDAAHQKGIVHRDLKPANVKITPDGIVKVLDFGIAKILSDASPDAPISPQAATLTVNATQAGNVLGTPGYMAPEQAQGKAVDRRVDIWAFGVMLYEMVAGERPFGGASTQETLAAILTTDPDWERVPPALQPLLRACLERDPRKRLRDISDHHFLIDQAASAVGSRGRSSSLGSSGLAGLALVALIASAAWVWSRPRADAPREPVRLTTMLPPGVNVTRGPGFAASVAVSPDGRTLVVAGTSKEDHRLYRRPLDQLEATPLAGTDRGSGPFFSPDGVWIGFFADGRLKRIPAAGGAAVDIVDVPSFASGASWGTDNRIIFAYRSQLYSVDAAGGNAEPLSGVPSGRHPEILPDGRTVLFESGGWIHSLDRTTGRQTRLVQGTGPRYAIGHVILSRGTTLLAAPIDLSRHEMTGPVVPLAEGVAAEVPGSAEGRHYAISNNGTLVYVPGANAYTVVLLEADGTERLLTEEQHSFENPRFSPDGRHVVVATTRREGEPADLWLHDIETKTATRLTFDGGRAPVWSPDGTSVTYSHLGERRGIYSKRADGRGDASQILSLDAFHWLVGWTPDRRTLAYGSMEGTPSSILTHSQGQSRRMVGPGSVWGGRLSRDGRWLAYYTLETGIFEVYVTPFPEGGTRWLIAEGTNPTWSPDDTEVYIAAARNSWPHVSTRLRGSARCRIDW